MKENFEIRYDFIAEDGTRHQDMDSVRAIKEQYWEYTAPKKVNQTELMESELKDVLKEQFETGFMIAYANMFMNNLDFREWNQYCHMLMKAVKSGVVKPQDIRTFALNLCLASVITITIYEHEEYLKNQKVLNGVIDTINLEQGQARR